MFFIYTRWLLVNSLFFGLFLYASYTGNENLVNIPVFFTWIISILSWLLISDAVVLEKIENYDNGKKFINKNIDFIFNIFFLFSILYYGYIWLGIFYFIHTMLTYSFRTKVEEGAKNV